MLAATLDRVGLEDRVLVLPPTPRDGSLTRQLLLDAGIASLLCDGLERICREVDRGAGAVILPEEAIGEPGIQRLVDLVERQPAWSDLPVLVLAKGIEPLRPPSTTLQRLGNVSFIDLPVRFETLVAAVRSALRARARQCQIREHLVRHERVEEALRQSEAHYRALFELAAAGMAQVDPGSGRLLRVNRKLCEVLGQTESDLLGRSLLALVSPDDQPEFERGVAALVAGDVAEYRAELRFAHPGGAPVWVLSSAVVVRDAAGRPLRVLCVLVDDSERRLAADALRESEARLRLALEAGRMGAWELDAALGRAVWSSSLEALHGTEPGPFSETVEEMFGRIHPDDREPVRASLAGSLDAGSDFRAEYRTLHPDGRVAWLESRGRVLRDEADGSLRMTGIAVDVTERRQAEETLREINLALRRSNEDLNQFAFAASHDLREPLRMVAIYSQLLPRRFGDRLNGEAGSFLQHVLGGVQRVDTLLSDLLVYSRVASPRDSTVELVDCGVALDAAIGNIRGAFPDSGAVVTRDPLPSVLAQSSHSILLFQNLLSNAIKFRSDQPPRIHVSAEQRSGEWLFSVRDNGIGIDPQYWKLIFGVFKRLHGREVPGTGIGLALCSRVVERYGGRIWVASEPGRGSTFFFTFPAGVAG
mgnify:CR=1 FL=1